MSKRAFTLIELLIVVAIIAILAAIAVPNFLEAQVRAKVSRAKSDLRTIAVALESYRTDWNNYPDWFLLWGIDPGGNYLVTTEPMVLSTPIAYITSYGGVFDDPFASPDDNWNKGRYNYHSDSMVKFHPQWNDADTWQGWMSRQTGMENVVEERNRWLVYSAGPDRIITWDSPYDIYFWPYDATNGTVSHGVIVRVGP